MNNSELIKSFDVKAPSGDGYKVSITIQPEDHEVDIDFGSEIEQRKYIERFETGELVNVSILVQVEHLHIRMDGFDSLGACHLRAKFLTEDVIQTVLDHSMVEQAIEYLVPCVGAINAILKRELD